MVVNVDEFNSAFKNNFYLTEEYAKFCSKITNKQYSKLTISNTGFYIIDKKNIGISNYSNELVKDFRGNKIKFMRVLPESNEESKKQSLIEYSLITKKPYEQIKDSYMRSFYDGLNQSKKYSLSMSIIDKYDQEIISKVYEVYKEQIKRLNSFVFPKYFFEEFMKLKHSFLMTIEHKKEIAAYVFCIKYKDNLYSSIGGSNYEFFKFRVNNRKYDEIIKYSCENNLNIHDGVGIKDSGYQIFKSNAGYIGYKCERYPDDENLLKFFMPITKSKPYGMILSHLSNNISQNILFEAMPFT
jgi:hypothetical protein